MQYFPLCPEKVQNVIHHTAGGVLDGCWLMCFLLPVSRSGRLPPSASRTSWPLRPESSFGRSTRTPGTPCWPTCTPSGRPRSRCARVSFRGVQRLPFVRLLTSMSFLFSGPGRECRRELGGTWEAGESGLLDPCGGRPQALAEGPVRRPAGQWRSQE